jgi:Flp pilus assembly protein TadG
LRPRRGAALVEFALCVPVLFMVLFVIVEFARVLQIQQSCRQAAFEGARAGVAIDAAATDAQTAAQNIMTAVGIKSPTITVSPNPLSYTSPTIAVTVSASPSTYGWFTRYFSGSSNISCTITLNREVQSVSVPH